MTQKGVIFTIVEVSRKSTGGKKRDKNEKRILVTTVALSFSPYLLFVKTPDFFGGGVKTLLLVFKQV